MINQINPNVAYKSIFTPLQSSGGPYAITKPFTEEQKKGVKEEVKKEEEKKGNKLGYKIAKIALVAGFGIFAVMKGLPKPVREKLNKLFDRLEDKISGMNKAESLSTLQHLYLKSLYKLKSLANFSKAIYNFAPFKDVIVMKALKKSPFLEKIGNGITNVFEKITVKRSRSAYDSTMPKFDRMYTNFDKKNTTILTQDLSKKINVRGTIKTKKEWIAEIEQKTKNIQANYDKNFREIAQEKRLQNAKKEFDGVDKLGNSKPENSIFNKVSNRIFGDFKGFWGNKKTYNTFLSEELAAEQKIVFVNNISMLKRAISNDVNDSYYATKKILSHIGAYVDPSEETSRVLIKNIRTNLQEYKKITSETPDSVINKINQNTSKNLFDLDNHIKKSGICDEETSLKISEYIKNANDILTENKRGEIQEILTIYKRLLPPAEYQKLKKDTYKTINGFNYAVDLESDKLFDKIRDLKIGAAPMDAVALLASLGIVGWGLTKADNKEERISVSLKYGIPTVGAIATTMYCTLGLIPAGKSVVIGLVSGAVINKLGAWVDKTRKKYQEKPLNLGEIALPTSIIPSGNKKNKDKVSSK